MKTLNNVNIEDAKNKVSDIEVFGDGDLFKLICKASSESEGWMKSTKAMEIEGVGCVVQVTTQQENPDGSYSLAEAITFVPNVKLDQKIGAENYHIISDMCVDIICAKELSESQLEELREEINKANNDPNYKIIANYSIEVEKVKL